MAVFGTSKSLRLGVIRLLMFAVFVGFLSNVFNLTVSFCTSLRDLRTLYSKTPLKNSKMLNDGRSVLSNQESQLQDKSTQDELMKHPTPSWMPIHHGIYNWSSVPAGLAPSLRRLFPTANSIKSSRTVAPVVASIHGYSHGLTDRLRGLHAISCLALLLERPLQVDPDYLSVNVMRPEPSRATTPWGEGPYYGIQKKFGAHKRWQNMSGIYQEAAAIPDEPLIVYTNLPPGSFCTSDTQVLQNLGIPLPSNATLEALAAWNQHCPVGNRRNTVVAIQRFAPTLPTMLHACSSMILHGAWGNSPVASERITLLKATEKRHRQWMRQILPANVTQYPLLHMRVGGSLLSVPDVDGNMVSFEAINWRDGHGGNRSSLWLEHMRHVVSSFPDIECDVPLIISTDSARFIGESAFALFPHQIAWCCASPLHIKFATQGSRRLEEAALSQILFDLISVSRAAVLVRTVGGFAQLGQTFLEYRWTVPKETTPTTTCTSEQCVVEEQWEHLWGAMSCHGKHPHASQDEYAMHG